MRVLIADDEPIARAGLRALLEEDESIEVVGECSNGLQALEAIERLRPDLVLLDVQMPDLDGFSVLRSLPRAEWPAIIFVTAFDQYAVDAFEHNAVDYLLKPFGDERGRAALQRARQRIASDAQADRARIDAAIAATGFLQRVAIRERGQTIVLPVDRIRWLESEGDYVRIHAIGATYLRRAKLTELADQLDPSRFVRVHRSSVVNLDRVVSVAPLGHGDMEAVLDDGTRVKVSRTFREGLTARFG